MKIVQAKTKTKIEKIFVINLKDKINLFKKFSRLNSLHKGIERFDAVDSRSHNKIYKDYGLSLNPVGLCSKFYFSESSGAIGCYLSHYSIWKSMIERGISSALILEDDVRISHVAQLLESGDHFSDLMKYDLIQFNTRTLKNYLNPFGTNTNAFNGTESYYLSLGGAKKLFSLTHNRDCFQGIIKDLPFEEHYVQGTDTTYAIYPQKFKMYENETPQDWTEKDTITCAVDKFIGYCSHPKLPSDIALKVKVSPRINLSEEGLTSDIEPKNNPYWNCEEDELIKFKKSKNFEWWAED
jgi:GR25 family glycosyltransferase involved in LPS biosynthesis